MATTVQMKIEATDGGSFGKVNNEAKKVYNTVDQTNKLLNKQAVRPASQTAASAKAMKETEGGSYAIARGTVGTGAEGRDFAKQAQGLGGLVHVYATFAANIFAVTAAFTALSKAMDIERMTKATNILAINSGRDLKGLAANLREVSDYAMSSAEAVQAVNFGTSAGLGAKQLEDLTKVAKGASLALGRDFSDSLSRVTRGAIKLEPELLDELGIVTKASEAYRAYGASIGVSADNLTKFQKTQAFTNAVISEGLDKYGDLVSIDASPFSKFMASFSDAAVSIGTFLNKTIAPILDKLSDSPVSMKGLLIGISVYLVSKAVPALQQWGLAAAEAASTATASAKAMYATLEAEQQKSIARRKAVAIEGANSIIAANQSAIANLSGSISKGFAASNKKIAPLLAEMSPVEGVSKDTTAAIQKSVTAGIAYNTRMAASTAASDTARAQAQTRLNALKEVEKTLTSEINAINAQAVVIAKQLDTVDTMAVASTEKLKLSWTGIKAKVLEAKAEVIQFIADMSTANVVATQAANKEAPQSNSKTTNVADKLGLAAGAVIVGETSEILDDLDKGTDKVKKGIAGLASGIGSFLSKAVGFLGWASLAFMALELLWPSLIHGDKEFQKLSESVDGFKDSANNIGDTITKLNTVMQSSLINPAKQAQKTYEILGNTVDQMVSKFEELAYSLNKGLTANEGLWGKLTGSKNTLVKETKEAAVEILSQLAKIKDSGITYDDVFKVSNANTKELPGILSEVAIKYAESAEKLKAMSANIGEVRNGWESANKKLSEYGKKQSELKSEFQPIHDNMEKFAALLDSMSTEDKIKQIIGLDPEAKAAISKYYPEFNKEMQTLLDSNSKLASATQAANEFWSSNTNSVIALKGALVGLNSEFNTYMSAFNKARRNKESGYDQLNKMGTSINTQKRALEIAKADPSTPKQAIIEAQRNLDNNMIEMAKLIDQEAAVAQRTTKVELSKDKMAGSTQQYSGKSTEGYEGYGYWSNRLNKQVSAAPADEADAIRFAMQLKNADATKTETTSTDKTFANRVIPPAEGLKKVKGSTSQFEPDKSHLQSLQKNLQVEEATLKTTQTQLGFRQQIGDNFSETYKQLQDSEITQKLVTIETKKELDLAKSKFDFEKAINKINTDENAVNKTQTIKDITHEYEVQQVSITNTAKEEKTRVEIDEKILKFNRLISPELERHLNLITSQTALLESQLAINDVSTTSYKEKLELLDAQKEILAQQLYVELKTLDAKMAQATEATDYVKVQQLEYEKQTKINQANLRALEIAKEQLQVRLRSSTIPLGKDVVEDFGNKVNDWHKSIKSAAEVMNEAFVNGLDKGIDSFYEALKAGELTLENISKGIGNFIEDTVFDMAKANLKKLVSEGLSGMFKGTPLESLLPNATPEVQLKDTIATQFPALILALNNNTAAVTGKVVPSIAGASGMSIAPRYQNANGDSDTMTKLRAGGKDFVSAADTTEKGAEVIDTGAKTLAESADTQSKATGFFSDSTKLFDLASTVSMAAAAAGEKNAAAFGIAIKLFQAVITAQSATSAVSGGSSGGIGGIIGGILEWFKSSPSTAVPAAKGGIFSSHSLGAYSNSIVSSPTTFAFARGGVPNRGLMGEAGPEAILPLKRDSSGNLGIRGGAEANIEVNVHNYGKEEATVNRTTDSRGKESIEVVIGKAVSSEIRRTGSTANSAVVAARPQLLRR